MVKRVDVQSIKGIRSRTPALLPFSNFTRTQVMRRIEIACSPVAVLELFENTAFCLLLCILENLRAVADFLTATQRLCLCVESAPYIIHAQQITGNIKAKRVD
jgi:hypothetical protein